MNTTKKILVVEDDKPLARALELKLKSQGFEASVVYNGEEGLSAMQTNKFDLLLIDIMMPKRDGFSVLAELQKGNNTTPVFVMSNLGQDEDIAKAKALGATDYIIKSNMDIEDIVVKVKTFLENK